MKTNCRTEVAEMLLENLDEYRRMNLFTDVTLITRNNGGDEVKFPAHRAILAAVSPYFAKMFTVSMIEAKANEIRINDIDAYTLRAIISVAYCGVIELNVNNVRNVLVASEYLGMDFLVNKCTEFYAKQLEMGNNLVVEIRNLHHTHGHIASLKLAIEKSNKYMKKNFEKFLQSNQFLELNIDDVVEILNWNGVCMRNEEPIFNAAIRWLEKDSKMRLQFAERVIYAVRLPQLSEQFLTNKVQQNQFVIGSEHCMEMVTKAKKIRLSNSSDPQRSAFSRNQTEIYVFPFDIGTQTHITKFNWALDEWTQIDLPTIATLRGRQRFGLAGHGQKFFLTGGYVNDMCDRKFTSFDIVSGNVLELRQMLEPRSYHCTIALDNSIFAIGGWDLSSIERYDIERDEWLRLSAMREKRGLLAGVVLKNRIYVFGGFDGSQDLNTVERFDPRVGTWEYLAPMSNRKSGAGAAVLDGKIYVSGGLNGNCLNTVEIYDNRANRWINGPSINIARECHGFVLNGSRLLAIGGKGIGWNDLNSVEIFDGCDQWTVTAMPSISGRVKAVVI